MDAPDAPQPRTPQPSTRPADILPPVSLLGGGPMALAIGSALLRAGVPLTVWNRTPARLDGLVADGAVRAGSVADAAAASPVVLANLVDHEVLDALLDAAGPALAGRVVVGLCSDVPARARRTGELVAGHGGRYLDGSLTTPAPTIGGDAGGLVVAGPPEVYDAVAPVLAALGRVEVVGTELGAAAALDVAALDFFWTAIGGYLHAVRLARGEGVDAAALLPHLHGMVDILPPILDDLTARVGEQRHGEPTATLASLGASLRHLTDTAAAHGLDSAALDALAAAVTRAVDAGHGEDGVSRLAA